jgi:hypothetical protein
MIMRSRFTRVGIRQRWVAAAAGFAVLSSLAFILPVTAQTYTPPPAPPQEKPGLFEAIGRWFDKSATSLQDHLRGAKQRMDNLGDDAANSSKQIESGATEVGKGAAEVGKGAVEVTKNTIDAVARLPTARVMRGRERCEIAPNGAPDCVTAAEALCRKHGFATGKSIDFTSAEDCPIKSYLGQGRDQCTTITFISQAMCQ